MKRRMIWIFLAGALAGIVLSGLYKHFVTDQIMDGGNGMENPYVYSDYQENSADPFSKRRAA